MRMCAGEFSGEIDTEFLLKESKHPLLQENLDKQLWEIDKRLERKEVMKFPFERISSCQLSSMQRGLCSFTSGLLPAL